MVMLETIGRKTGRTLTLPMVVATFEGERYIVSMLGENSAWIRNMRAANNEAVLRFGSPSACVWSMFHLPSAHRSCACI